MLMPLFFYRYCFYQLILRSQGLSKQIVIAQLYYIVEVVLYRFQNTLLIMFS